MGARGFKSLIALCVSIATLYIWTASDGSPAAVHRAWLFTMLPVTLQDAYVGFTLANITWLACAIYHGIKAAGSQLSRQISVFSGHAFNYLKFLVATIYSWSKALLDAAVVLASGIINDATIVLTEISNTSTHLHSHLEDKFSSTVAHCVVGFLAIAVLLLLLRISAVVMIALHSVVTNLGRAGRIVHWRRVFLLSMASVFGYVGYLWTMGVPI